MNNAEVLIKFRADDTEAKSVEKKQEENLKSLKKTGENVAIGLTAAVNGLVGAFVGMGVSYNAEIETYLTRLTSLTGSVDKANQILDQIKKDALATPFEVSSLVQGESLLLATGISADQARQDIINLGNAISASGGGNAELSRMAVNLQQIKNVGKASALDIKQFAYAGIDIYGLLADSMGITRAEASDLDVTYEMLSDALAKASAEGGKYYGAMEKQSKTMNGATSNLKESWQVFAGTMSQEVFEAVKNLIPKLTSLLDWLTENKNLVMAIVIPFLTFINILAGFLIIKKIVTAIAAFNAVLLANPIVAIIAAILALVAGFIYLWNHCEAFRNFWKNLWKGIVNIFNNVVNAIKGALKAVGDFFVNTFTAIGDFISSAVQYLINSFLMLPQFVGECIASVIEFLKQIPYYLGYLIGWLFGTVVNWIKNFFVNIWNAIVAFFNWLATMPGKCIEFVQNMLDAITTWKDQMIEKIATLIDNTIAFFRELPGKIWDALVNAYNRISEWVQNIWNKISTAIPELIRNIIKWFKELPGKLGDIGKNIVEGLWNGIKNATKWINKKVGDFAKGILDGMKDALGIHSPSKEFAILGKFSVLGYTEALDDMQDTVDKQINDTFGISPQLENSSSLHYSPNVVVNNEVNVSQDPLGQMVSNIKSFSGGAKNDYNFGMGV